MANSFDEKAATYDSERQLTLVDKFSQATAERLGDKHLNRLLDFGGGTSNLAITLANHYNQGVVADINQPILDQAQKKIEQSRIDHLKVENLSQISLSEFGKFQVILASLVLHHIPHDEETISQLLVALDAEGKFFIIVFYSDNADEEKHGFSSNQIRLIAENNQAKITYEKEIAHGFKLFLRQEGRVFLTEIRKES